MNTDFVILRLTRKEALDCFKGLMLLKLVEEEVRAGKGLEFVDFMEITERLRLVLDLNEEQWQKMAESLSEDMWEYAWYAYTSEWAWFRARQEARKIKKAEKGKKKTLVSDSEMAEKLYEEKFDRYVAEINMMNASRTNFLATRFSKE